MIADRCFDCSELHSFLIRMDEEFNPPLSQQVARTGTTLKEYAKKLSRKGTIAYVRDGSDLVAVVIGYTHDTPNEETYITQVVVDPRYRGRGICRSLMNEYLDYCREIGLRYAWLTTGEENRAARSSYERTGFNLIDAKGRIVKYGMSLR